VFDEVKKKNIKKGKNNLIKIIIILIGSHLTYLGSLQK
jgi:hypothetical protein